MIVKPSLQVKASLKTLYFKENLLRLKSEAFTESEGFTIVFFLPQLTGINTLRM